MVAQIPSMSPVDCIYYEQIISILDLFAKVVRKLSLVMEGMGNPFLEDSNDPLVTDTIDIVGMSVVETVQQTERTGLEIYSRFIRET